MSDQPRTRQELYDRIRQTSKDEFILEEMVRLGFWPAASPHPHDPVNELQRKNAILQELRSLQTEAWRLNDVNKLRAEALKRRLEASRKRREETRARNKAKAEAKVLAWKEKKTQDLVYLGPKVSHLLHRKDGAPEKLTAAGLPAIPDIPSLAALLGCSVGGLRFLAWHREVSKTSHYVRFRIPKKTGGTRLISAPMPNLKRAQGWILAQILEKIPVHEAAHGFVPGRSIVTNARQHTGRDVVVNLDLEGFFPSVGWHRARGLFHRMGYSPQVATVLALLCSEADTVEADMDGVRWYIATSERRLPQGSPASPMLTNLLCRRLDKRLTGLAQSLGFTYTRYADDLTFSGSQEAAAKVGKLLKSANWIVTQEGFKVHPDKTSIQRKGSHQEVTGLVVNDRLGVPRTTLRKFRALLHKLKQVSPDDPVVSTLRWGAGELISSMRGFAGFVAMVDPQRGGGLIAEVDALKLRFRSAIVPVLPGAVPLVPETPQVTEPVPEAPPPSPNEWWKLF